MARVNRQKNVRTAVVCFSVVAGMVGLSFASVPLYQWFCQVTGFGGTTQVAEAAPGATAEAPVITVRFDATTASSLPWRFRAEQLEMQVKPGDQELAFYSAKNVGDQAVVGTATFNVTPYKVGPYFSKIQCFCFTEQELVPGQAMDMPVQFFIDPDMLTDPNTKDVRNIVLSYTFHEAKPDDAADVLRRTSSISTEVRPEG